MERFAVVSEVVAEVMFVANGLTAGETINTGYLLFDGTPDEMDVSITILRDTDGYAVSLVKNIPPSKAIETDLELRYSLTKELQTLDDVEGFITFSLL